MIGMKAARTQHHEGVVRPVAINHAAAHGHLHVAGLAGSAHTTRLHADVLPHAQAVRHTEPIFGMHEADLQKSVTTAGDAEVAALSMSSKTPDYTMWIGNDCTGR